MTPAVLSAPAALAGVARALAASLPLSFRFSAEPGAATAMLVDGAGGWAAAAGTLVAAGVARIVVIDPDDDDPDAILALAEQVGRGTSQVTLAEAQAGNPAVAPFRDALDAGFNAIVLDALSGDAVARSLLVQLRLARALGLSGLAVRDARLTAGGAIVTAWARGVAPRVAVRAVVGVTDAVAPRHRVRAYAAAALAEMTLPPADTATPASVEIVRADGLRSPPTVYETAHRVALRAPPPRLTGPDALRAFAADVELVRALTARRP